MLTDEERRAISDYRFARRIATEAGAARSLIEIGLNTAKTKGPAGTAIPPSHEHVHPSTGKDNEHPNS